MKGIEFPLNGPGEVPVVFRFTIKAARDMEKAAGCNYQKLIEDTRQIEAICLMTCYGLKHDQPKMTLDKAVDLVDAFVDKGGSIVDLGIALQKAMLKSGCYGTPIDIDALGEVKPADPQEPTA